METDPPKNLFIRRLAEKHRVLLGGMAVIAHGRSRHTKDFDIWLEPFSNPEVWAEHLSDVLNEFQESYVWPLADRRKLEQQEIAPEISDYGVLRIGGLNLPIDVFRKPNELEPEDFEWVWSQSTIMEGGVRLPHELHLYVTKINTGRAHDLDDIAFLEGRVKARFRERLPVCDFAEAKDMLDRFLDSEVLQYGLDNPAAAVRELVLGYLHEFESEGDPYSVTSWRRGGRGQPDRLQPRPSCGRYFITPMSDTTATAHKFTNALAKERSPYLLQHAHNPVNWLPWSEEAFKKAKAEDKPIFLSSGYSTCHWCHVMERESFENEETAKLINEHFIPIKVDREERPDVDLTYMTYVQAASGHGGWPMSVFLTPELKPFYGGTYYPPENTPGRIGFKNLLNELHKVWTEDRKGIEERAANSVQKLQDHLDNENAAVTDINHDTLVQKAYDDLSGSFDYHEGGFGGAPKFPRPTGLNLLMRIHRILAERNGNDRESESNWAMEMTVKTLRGMANGGMRDHIGGGFHRYSVDAYWHIPHYEKMLYDQAQLLTAYTEAWQLTQNTFFETIVRSTVAYLKRDLRQKDGGFFSAEDADSLATADAAHKTEGAFYVWTAAEIDELLGKEDGSIFRYAYGARRDGNARPESDPQGELKGLNTLYRAISFKKTAEFFKKSPEEVKAIIDQGSTTLFEAREKRPRPHLDDKVIAAWNGLMIAGLARAGAAFGDAEMIALATDAAQFLHDQLCTTPGKELHRSWRAGERGPRAFAIDYACLIHGLLDLYQASFDVKWLQWATALQTEMDTLFLDTKDGGYYSVHTDMPNSVLRIKEDYDGAEPSPNSLAALNLVRLSTLLDKDEWKQQAGKIFALFGSTLQSSPSSVPVMAIAFDLSHRGKQQIVLAGDASNAAFKALSSNIHRRFLPTAVILHADGGAGQQWLATHNEVLAGMKPVNGQPAAYVCQNFTCQAPVTTVEELEKVLGK